MILGQKSARMRVEIEETTAIVANVKVMLAGLPTKAPTFQQGQ